MKRKLLVLCCAIGTALCFPVLSSAALYICGSVKDNNGTNNGWDPVNSIEMTDLGNGKYQAVIIDDESVDGEFKILTQKSWENNWGAYTESYQLNDYQQEYGMTSNNGKNFKLPQNKTCIVMVDISNSSKYVLHTITTDTKFYILGQTSQNDYSWDSNRGTELKNNNNAIYSGYVALGNSLTDLTSNPEFQIVTKLATKWDDIARYRYGPADNSKFAQNDNKNWSVAPGLYKITVDALNSTIKYEPILCPSAVTYSNEVEKTETEVKQLNCNIDITNSVATTGYDIDYLCSGLNNENAFENTISDIELKQDFVTTLSARIKEKDTENVLATLPVYSLKITTDYTTAAVSNFTVELLKNSYFDKETKSYKYAALINFDAPVCDNPASKYEIYKVGVSNTLVTTINGDYDFNNKPQLNVTSESTMPYVYLDELNDAPTSVTYMVVAVYAADNSKITKSTNSDELTSGDIITSAPTATTDKASVVYNSEDATLQIKSTTAINTLGVYAVNGTLVRALTNANTDATVDMQGLHAGLYLVKVNETVTKVLVK